MSGRCPLTAGTVRMGRSGADSVPLFQSFFFLSRFFLRSSFWSAGRSFPFRKRWCPVHQLLFEQHLNGCAHDVLPDGGKSFGWNAPHLTDDAANASAAAPGSVPPCGKCLRTATNSLWIIAFKVRGSNSTRAHGSALSPGGRAPALAVRQHWPCARTSPARPRWLCPCASATGRWPVAAPGPRRSFS